MGSANVNVKFPGAIMYPLVSSSMVENPPLSSTVISFLFQRPRVQEISKKSPHFSTTAGPTPTFLVNAQPHVSAVRFSPDGPSEAPKHW